MLYAGDEVYNLDAAVNFFTRLDYTTNGLGGHPFDPVVSSGILTSWTNGLVFIFHGNLFHARLITGLTLMVVSCFLTWIFLRQRDFSPINCSLIAVALWTALIPVGSHYTRIINPGELWGILYIVAGCLMISRSPIGAAFLWGLAVWLVKVIYLPIALPLLAALAISARQQGSSGEEGSTPRRLAIFFVLPLLIWASLIFLRYDASTLIGWASSYLNFVGKHTAELSISSLPTPSEWRFDPDWSHNNPFMSWGWNFTGPYLIPLALSLTVIALYALFSISGHIRSGTREQHLFWAAVVGMTIEVVWFFAIDPAQWGRHMMPGLYLAIALALYSSVKIWESSTRSTLGITVGSAIVGLSILISGYVSATSTSNYTSTRHWKGSYAKTCKGRNVTQAPCKNQEALKLIHQLAVEFCDSENPFDANDQCMFKERKRFLERGLQVLANPDAEQASIDNAGYMILLIQSYNYLFEDEFISEFGSLICHRLSGQFEERLRAIGLDRPLSDFCPQEEQPIASV